MRYPLAMVLSILALVGCAGRPGEPASSASPAPDNGLPVSTPVASPSPSVLWHPTAAAAIAAGKADGRPAVIVVCDHDDSEAIDARRWLLDDPAALDQLAGTHPALAWRVDTRLAGLELPAGISRVLPDGRARHYALPRSRGEVGAVLARVRDGSEASGRNDQWLAAVAPLVQPAQRDDAARDRLAEQVGTLLDAPLDPARAQALAWLVREADVPALRARLAERLVALAVEPAERGVADAAVDLADDLVGAGDLATARRLYAVARAHAVGSPAMSAAVGIAEAIALAPSSPARAAWERRRVLDVVVLVPDAATYAATIARWRHDAFFPVLIADDRLAPRFIAAFKPQRVVLAPACGGVPPDADSLRAALLASWSGDALLADDAALRARLAALGFPADGVVIADPASPEALGGLALAAGRFQGISFVAPPMHGDEAKPAGPEDRLSRAEAIAFAGTLDAQLAAWSSPTPAWRTITLAGRYPFRWLGPFNWGVDCCIDDLVGRDEDGIRRAVCSRLIGDEARGIYQAMASLFLEPRTALLYDTYEQTPRTIFGRYRLAGLPEAYRGRIAAELLTRTPITGFRARTAPWRTHDSLVITSSGGAHDWSAPGQGTAEDAPVGAPCFVHVTHSGSAALPYDDDSIAGRMLWGGAWYYFGSMSEPFLTAFQPATYAGPRIAAGVPFTSAYRTRVGQSASGPWRLIAIGDPQACLRREPMARAPASAELLSLGADAAQPAEAPMAQLRRARLLRDSAGVDSALAALDAASLDGASLAAALDACLERDACERAEALWRAAPATARTDVDARRCARIAAGARLDRALAAGTYPALRDHLRAALATGPRVNWIERWLERIAERAQRDGGLPEWRALLLAEVQEAAPEHAAPMQASLATLDLESALRVERWWPQERAAFVDALARLADAGRPASELVAAIDRAAPRADRDAGAGSLLSEVRARAGGDGSPLHQAVVEVEQRRRWQRDWLILGPFRAGSDGAAVLESQASVIDPQRRWRDGQDTRAWRRPFAGLDGGFVDLLPLCTPNENVHAYAAALVVAERETTGWLLLGSDDGIAAWLGGKEVHRNPTARGLTPDQDRVSVTLRPGRQWLLLRIDQLGGGWGFSARFAADQQGTKPLEGVRIECPELR